MCFFLPYKLFCCVTRAACTGTAGRSCQSYSGPLHPLLFSMIKTKFNVKNLYTIRFCSYATNFACFINFWSTYHVHKRIFVAYNFFFAITTVVWCRFLKRFLIFKINETWLSDFELHGLFSLIQKIVFLGTGSGRPNSGIIRNQPIRTFWTFFGGKLQNWTKLSFNITSIWFYAWRSLNLLPQDSQTSSSNVTHVWRNASSKFMILIWSMCTCIHSMNVGWIQFMKQWNLSCESRLTMYQAVEFFKLTWSMHTIDQMSIMMLIHKDPKCESK